MSKQSFPRIPRAAWILAAGLGAAMAAPKAPSPADSAAIVPPGHEERMECMADSGELAKLRQTLQVALKSGDKGKMKGALEAADAHFAKMQAKMEKCKAKMGKTGGGMDEMMCGKEHGEAGAHPGKAEADPHNAHH